jgi:hypothetical protein
VTAKDPVKRPAAAAPAMIDLDGNIVCFSFRLRLLAKRSPMRCLRVVSNSQPAGIIFRSTRAPRWVLKLRDTEMGWCKTLPRHSDRSLLLSDAAHVRPKTFSIDWCVHLQASHRTLWDGSFGVTLSQALRARLRSHRPSGTFQTGFRRPSGGFPPTVLSGRQDGRLDLACSQTI